MWPRLVLAALVVFPLLAGAAGRVNVLGAGAGDVRIEGVEVLFEAAGERLTAEGAMSHPLAGRWAASSEKTINLTREERPAWLRFTVRNEAPADKRWVLAIEWPMIDRIEFHTREPASGAWNPVRRGGIEAGTAARWLKDPAFVFPLDIPEGGVRQVVLRVESHTAYLVPLVVSDAARFQARRFDTAVLMGALFGVIGVMFLYNIALSVFVREKSYAIYSVYLLFVLLYELTVTGYGAMYLWPGAGWLLRHDYEVFSCASFLAATLFFRFFLDLDRVRPRYLRQVNTGLAVYWAVALAASAVWPNRPLLTSTGLMGLVSAGIGVWMSVVLIRQGNRYARYFAVAWAMVTIGTVASLLSVLGAIEGGWFADNAQHIGFALESLLLSVALADRIKREREARERAQQQALDLTERVRLEREAKIEAQAQAIEVQALAQERLEQRVRDRTAELERTLAILARANEELARSSVTDGLTGVFNRRHFDEVLLRETRRSGRAGVPVALLLVDIDHFKSVNDRFGHLAGDECLRLVAATLRQVAARASDLVARYGGEEFALVLPGTAADQALEVAERVRSTVEALAFVQGGQRVPVTVSIGVMAAVTPSASGVDCLVAGADAALYRAKAAGRNRVELAG
ncbi:sensor domain-containing diguanylate cyclase [Piscinibacter gummiphilus]|uniref:diguanylate cyclase n=1 Tax=Piscinibacter gummiphilus TaxID=946333 RepID=A0A1W6L682_9BURK|nr:diguanylate cyclase [Piscinibacter gummiphilus]ARN19795.1 hypothetical protein A4W93_07640 [Piscinibacter gummiphilus]ATU64466.1 hypothetical protein CPZ87_07720 [Piscinibacter gummiphilus]GLS95131.1 deoxynucleoside kinase [Piscinibacter gummiphilus]